MEKEEQQRHTRQTGRTTIPNSKGESRAL